MAGISFWQVDAFTDRAFAGNPAAVCLLDSECDADDGTRFDAAWMQAVAAEMNLSETAFVQRFNSEQAAAVHARDDEAHFSLRWFTPTIEVDLCGHATLAAAHTMWISKRVEPQRAIVFHTRSGVLTAKRNGERIEVDFPATPCVACAAPQELIEALGADPQFVGKTVFDRFVVVDSEQTVRTLQPDFRKLAAVAARGVIVTARSDDARFDFVSRFFAPASGVDEDPVTGSAHCCLGPYWSEQLGKADLIGYQASLRGGIVHVRVEGDRVVLGGCAVLVMRGELV